MGRVPSEPEPEFLDIEFMPLPIVIKKTGGWKWENLLKPVRAAPGSSARIRTHAKIENAKAEVRRIKARLEEKCPYENWEFQVLHLQDNSANVGIFATYRGILTEQQRHERMMLKKVYSERAKKSHVKRKLNRPDPIDNVSLIRPSPRYRP